MQTVTPGDAERVAAWVKAEVEKLIMSGKAGKITLDIGPGGGNVRGSVTVTAETLLPRRPGAGH